MAANLPPKNTLEFSRFDETNLLSTVSPHSIELEDQVWKTTEHYVQAGLVGSSELAEKIKHAETAQLAMKLSHVWFWQKKRNWKTLRKLLMTRALYTKCMMYPLVKQHLLDTEDKKIIETSAYDHYWGIGRDQRGDNTLGKIWMDIRQKIRHDEK